MVAEHAGSVLPGHVTRTQIMLCREYKLEIKATFSLRYSYSTVAVLSRKCSGLYCKVRQVRETKIIFKSEIKGMYPAV